MELKNKTISGLKWSFTDSLVNQIIGFFIGIVLARLLSPSDYGIIGMAMVFISISEALVASGLKDALIRKEKCSEIDYSTMFYTNIVLGLIMFTVIFFSADFIAKFYNMPELKILTRVMSVNLFINSFGMVEHAMLTRQIDFKRQTKITLIANSTSGVLGITLAFLGFGYWSLVIRTLFQNTLRVSLLHFSSKWKPKLLYSIESFKEMFGFGVKLLVSSMIATVYRNIYQMIIGKYFSSAELGYYSRANQFKNLPSNNLEQTTSRVTFPVLSSIAAEGDMDKLRAGYRKLIKLMYYITATLMAIMIVNAREIVLILIGEKWAPAIDYLKIICISGAFYPLHAINLNALKALGRSDLFLKLEIIKKIIVIPFIVIGVRYGMIVLLWGMVANSFIAYLFNSMYSAKLIGYSTIKQLWDIVPTTIHALIMAGLAFAVGAVAPSNLFVSLFLKTGVVAAYIMLTGRLLKITEYQELKSIVVEQIQGVFMNFKK